MFTDNRLLCILERKKPEPPAVNVPEWIPGPRKDITTETDRPGDEDCGRFGRRDHRKFGLI